MLEVIGTKLVLENDKFRVWHLKLEPGSKFPLHKHCCSYLWTALLPGTALVTDENGVESQVSFEIGDSAYEHLSPGDSVVHSIHNVGPTELLFVAVEIKEIQN